VRSVQELEPRSDTSLIHRRRKHDVKNFPVQYFQISEISLFFKVSKFYLFVLWTK